MSDDLLEAALRYGRQGYRVFPVRRGSKIPLLKDWTAQATSSGKKIRKLWQKHPGANVGVATGRASNLYVLDIDSATHPEADAELAALEAVNGSLPSTHGVRTASGGRHLWFAWPEVADADSATWRNSAGALGVGLDVRAEGGYVLAAPSTVDNDATGKPYENGSRIVKAKKKVKVEPVPAWLADLTRAKPPASTSAPSEDVTDFSPHDRARLAKWTETTLGNLAAELDALKRDPNSQWDNGVFQRAARLVEIAKAPWSPLTIDEARVWILNHSPRDDGFPESRILAKFDSARKSDSIAPLPITLSPDFLEMPAPATSAPTGNEETATATDTRRELPEALAEELRQNPGLASKVEDLALYRRAKEIDAELVGLADIAPAVDYGTLDEILGRKDETRWRIEGVLAVDGRMTVVAPRKAGKTTLVGNVVRSILNADEPFLGAFPTAPITGSVMILNYEVSGPTMAGWLADQGLAATADRIHLVNLRGRKNLLDTPQGRTELVAMMQAAHVEFLIVDNFGAAMTGNQNDPSEGSAWTRMLNTVATAGGASEILLVVHAGWEGTRSRGFSGLEDWPDTIANIELSGSGTNLDLNGPRFFRAFGRDVAVEKARLDFDPETRLLSYSGITVGATRTAKKVSILAEPILEIVGRTPGITVGYLDQEIAKQRGDLKYQTGDISRARKALVAEGRLFMAKDGKTTHNYLPADVPKKFRVDFDLDPRGPIM